MNKLYPFIASVLIAPVLLVGCGKAADAPAPAQERNSAQISTETPNDKVLKDDRHTDRDLRITIDGENFSDIYCRPPVSGVLRRFARDNSGVYTVEYVHTPIGVDEDDTLDYRLQLNADNTFDLTVTSEGVTVEHNGRWYERKDQIMMFYDEHVDPPAHNVYISDCLYGEKLCGGKIMIYENCRTIVLARLQPELYAR